MANPARWGEDTSAIPATAVLVDDFEGVVTGVGAGSFQGACLRVRRWRHVRRPRDPQGGQRETLIEWVMITEVGRPPMVSRFIGKSLPEAAQTVAYFRSIVTQRNAGKTLLDRVSDLANNQQVVYREAREHGATAKAALELAENTPARPRSRMCKLGKDST